MRLKSSVRRKVENRIVTEYLGFKKYFFLKWAFILKENATFALQMLHVQQTTGMLALESGSLFVIAIKELSGRQREAVRHLS